MRSIQALFFGALLAMAQEHPQTPPAGGAPSSGDKTGHATGQAPEGDAHAGQAEQHKGGGHSAMANEIWWKWANFALLAGLLGYLINKNAGPFFAARTEAIRKDIEGGAAMKTEAEERAAAIERQIAGLSAQVEEMRRASQKEMTAENERIREETDKALAKVRAQGQAEIEAAAKTAREELKAFSAGLALDLAGKKIQQRLTPETQGQLAQSFIEDLKKKAAGN